MPRTEIIKNNFNGGEISPNLLGRTDLGKYHNACESITNFIAKVQGGLERRAGTRYICDARGPSRLIPFVISVDQQYVLEFGHQYIQFYTNDGQIQIGPNYPYAIPSPYQQWELWDIHYAQLISTMYLVNPNHPPMKLIRINDTNWSLVILSPFAPPAFTSDQDIGSSGELGGIQVVIEVVADPAHPKILSSYPVWIRGDVGKQIVAGTGVAYIGGLENAPGVTDPYTGALLYAQADVSFQEPFDKVFYNPGEWFMRGGPSGWFSPGIIENQPTHTYWHGAPPRAYGNNVPVYSLAAHPTDASWQTSTGTAYQNIQYLAGTIDCFRSIDYGVMIAFDGGYGMITAVQTSYLVIVTMLNVTKVHEQDAYGGPLMAPVPPGGWVYDFACYGPGNYPHAVCFYGDRLYYAGTEGPTPNTIWGSNVGDYDNFALGSGDADGIRFTINSSSFEHIHWMTVYQGNIVLGGLKNEYIVNGGAGQAVQSAGAPITPSNINVIKQSQYGVAAVQAIEIDNDLFFIQRAQTKVYQFAFNPLTSSYGSRNLNVLNEIVTKAHVKEMFFQENPYKVIWFTDWANNLFGLTYDKEQDVWAWHRHETGKDSEDRVISISVIQTTGDTLDELWLLCQRVRGNTTTYTIEIMDNSLYLDSASHQVFTTPVTSVSNLQYLLNREVMAVVDGKVMPPITISSTGIYPLPAAISGFDVQVGIPFISSALTVRPEPKSTVQGLIKRWVRLWARVYSSIGLYLNNQEVIFRETDMIMGRAVPQYTGDVSVVNLGYDRDGRVLIEQRQPLPSNILAIFGAFEVSDGF